MPKNAKYLNIIEFKNLVITPTCSWGGVGFFGSVEVVVVDMGQGSR